ncbi:helix-turn-helix domain-containing protein [Paenibacillus thailandensis]|uniref:Helix-turn-helix domain-containing protein n=1 Tax=Paenibacillus thailandensis TaxID=393250 RepID=A0ABW5QRJ1_9BACL
MENDLFDLVQKAQSGDRAALQEIISMFMPAVRSAKYKIKSDRRDDLEQSIVETMIKKIMAYDLTSTPDFSEFCKQLCKWNG